MLNIKDADEAAKLRQQLNHLAEPLVEFGRRVAQLRRAGHDVTVAAVNDGPTDDTGTPGLKVYTDDGWVMVDLACELRDGMHKRPAGLITFGTECKDPFRFGDVPEVGGEPHTLGVLLTGDALPSPGQEFHDVKV